MTDYEFWEIIARIDLCALDRGDEQAAVRPVQAALSDKKEAELAEFEEVLAQKLYAIDGEAYAKMPVSLVVRMMLSSTPASMSSPRGASITRRFAPIRSGCPNLSDSGVSLFSMR